MHPEVQKQKTTKLVYKAVTASGLFITYVLLICMMYENPVLLPSTMNQANQYVPKEESDLVWVNWKGHDGKFSQLSPDKEWHPKALAAKDRSPKRKEVQMKEQTMEPLFVVEKPDFASKPRWVNISMNKKLTEDTDALNAKTAADLLKGRTPVKYELLSSLDDRHSLIIPKIGQWKPGALHQQTCALQKTSRLARCCPEGANQRHFEFFNTKLKNDKSVLNDFLSNVKGKSVLLLGDSIQKNLFFGLAQLFELGKLRLVLYIFSFFSSLHE